MKSLRLAALLAVLPALARAGDAFDSLQALSAATAVPAPVVRSASRGPGSSTGQPLANFAKVSDALYRSAQPNQQGVQQLAAKGIKTILKLNFDDPAESQWASASGIELIEQLMDNRSSPTYDQIDAALAVINDPAKQPVLVHCHHGADRTGAVVAAYRVKVQGWTVAQAAAEAKSFGYGSPGFQDITTWLNGYLARP